MSETPDPAPNMPSPHMPTWKIWLLAARPATLPAAIVPVCVGTAAGLFSAPFALFPFLAAFVAAVLIQIGTNLANDVFDFEKGADTAERLGPPRVTQMGLATPEQVRFGMLLSFGLAALIGLYLTTIGGWPILVIGVLCIVAGVAYTGGPWPLGYHGLGDVTVFLFFGCVAVMGSAYLQTGEWGAVPLAASLPIGCTVTAILVVNNLRDIETDRQAGKKTLAVRMGDRLTRLQYSALMLLPYVFVTVFVAFSLFPWTCLLPWLTLPLAWLRVQTVHSGAARQELNTILKGTAQLHLFFGSALTVGMLL